MRTRRMIGGGLGVLVLVLGSCTSGAERSGADPAPASTSPGTSASAPESESDPESESESQGESTAPRRTVTVAMAGDVLLHEGLWETAKVDGGGAMDFSEILSGMQPVFSSADLAICHLETPVAPPKGPFAGYPLFNAPPRIVPALREAGFDVCTTASNHSVDTGFEGVRRTLRTLDRHGIGHAGTARTAREARKPAVFTAAGVRIGLVSQTYSTNGMPVERPWSVQLIDPADIERRARAARADGAEIVLVALHWGTEYQHEPTAEQRRLARRLLRSPDIDLVYGHHAHVVQPFERVGRKWVAYGLGNMIAQQSTPATNTYDGVTARFTFVERPSGRFRVSTAEYVPTYITRMDWSDPDMRLVDVTAALPSGTPQAPPPELRASLRRTNTAVDLLGARRDGLRRHR